MQTSFIAYVSLRETQSSVTACGRASSFAKGAFSLRGDEREYSGVLRMRIILASQSPRRRELLERMGISRFEVIPAQGEEYMDPDLEPAQLVEELSQRKCAEVAAAHPKDLVIAADSSPAGSMWSTPGLP